MVLCMWYSSCGAGEDIIRECETVQLGGRLIPICLSSCGLTYDESDQSKPSWRGCVKIGLSAHRFSTFVKREEKRREGKRREEKKREEERTKEEKRGQEEGRGVINQTAY